MMRPVGVTRPIWLLACLVSCTGRDTTPGDQDADSDAADTESTDTDAEVPVDPPVAAAEWTVDDGVRLAGVTSSCTLRLTDGSYRIYYGPSGPATDGPFRSSTSSDGLSWSSPTDAGIAKVGNEKLSNSSVVPLDDGTYVMLFESQEEGASEHRFHRATSADGVSFVRTEGPLTGGAVMEPEEGDLDFLSVPDLIRLDDGRLRVYFVARERLIEAAISSDDGITWEREGPVTLEGDSASFQVDPDVLSIPGGYWLFFAVTPTDALENHHIRSATSADGLSFVVEDGFRVIPDDDTMIRYDPDVVPTGDGRYRVYFGQVDGEGGPSLHSAVSP